MYHVPGAIQQAVNVHGLRIAYREAGTGPPVVLLHGLAYSWLTWAANIPALARHFTVYAPDLPGHGDSDQPVLSYDLELGARLVGRFIEAVGLPPVALVGHSLGGALALSYAHAYPERVNHLVLVDSAGLGRRLSPFLRLLSIPGMAELLLNGKFITVGGVGKRLFQRPERVEPSLLRALHWARTAQVSGSVMRTMARAGVGMTGLRPKDDLLPHLGELSVPVLVVWGEHDRVMPVEHAREVARRFPHVAVHILPDVGHWPHMEDAAFNELVVRFLTAGRSSPDS